MLIKAGVEVDDKKEFPYEVYRPDARAIPAKFKTWPQAAKWRNRWNKQIAGFRARKRREIC